MALSSLNTVNQALHNIHQTASTAPMPLDAIEERRAARTAEELKNFRAQSERMGVDEEIAAGKNTRATQARTEAYTKGGPQMPENPTPEQFVNSVRERAAYLMQSGIPDLVTKGTTMLQTLPQALKAMGKGTGTLGEEDLNSQQALRKAQAANQWSQQRLNDATDPNLRAGGGGGKENTIDSVLKREELLRDFFTDSITPATDQKINPASRKFMYEEFKFNLEKAAQGNKKGATDQNTVPSVYRETFNSYVPVERGSMWNKEIVYVPRKVYDRYLKENPHLTEEDIADKFVEAQVIKNRGIKHTGDIAR